MCPADARKEQKERAAAPVGERPQDVRGSEETIKRLDAEHLKDEAEQGTSPLDTFDGEPDTSMNTGVERRHAQGGRGAMTPDGKPYGESQDPDSLSDGKSNLGDV